MTQSDRPSGLLRAWRSELYFTTQWETVQATSRLRTSRRANHLGVLVLFLALKAWRRHQFFRQLRTDRITVQELFRLREEGVAVILVDARPSASRVRDGVIPGAIALDVTLNMRTIS